MNCSGLLSFYRSLRRYKLHAILNIGGLALGISVFVTLGLYVRFETSFETWLRDHDQIYLVQTELHLPGSPFNGSYPGTMAGLLEQMRDSFPGLIGTRIRGGKDGGSVLSAGNPSTEDIGQVDPSFFDIFDLPMIEGNGARALTDPSAVLISRSIASKYFGTSDPIGQTMTIAVDEPSNYRVAGVFEDLPPNTDLRLSILIPIPKKPPPAEWMWFKWGTASVATYLRFPTSAAARSFEQGLPEFIRQHAQQDLGPSPEKVISLPLLPITESHLQPPGAESASLKLTVAALGIVGCLTLLIAVVNYVNLSTARATLRAREVAIRKVLGADRTTLILQFLGEAILAAALASLGGLIIAEIGLPLINAAGALPLTIPYALIVPALFSMTVLIGVLAGFYPALLLSRIPAAVVLASAHAPGGGRAGTRVREALVALQFGVAVALIAGTIVLVAQTFHLRSTDLGFPRKGLIIVPSLADKRISPDQTRQILAAFSQLPGTISVGTGNAGAGGDGGGNLDVIEMPGQPGPGLTATAITVGPGFFRTYSPRLLAGRFFDDAHGADDASDWTKWNQGRNIVINRRALVMLGFRSPSDAVGKTVGGSYPRTIIGVIDQLDFFSPRTPDNAIYYQYNRNVPIAPVAAIRFAGAPSPMLDRVAASWRRLAPQVPLVADTADRRLAQFYLADDRAVRLFGLGAILAVLIACVGLCGLASFDTVRRTKEIGIRRVLGASSGDIVKLLVGQFLRPVLLANFLAWPLAYVAMRRWLVGFEDRIALSPLYFIAASLLATIIAALTVFAQSLHASRASPARALRQD